MFNILKKYWYEYNMFPLSFLPSYMLLFPSIQQPCQVQPHATMCTISSEEKIVWIPNWFWWTVYSQVQCACFMLQCLIFSVVYVSCIRIEYQKQILGWKRLNLCSIVLELCGIPAALSGSSLKNCQKWKLWRLMQRCSPLVLAPQCLAVSSRDRMLFWMRLRPCMSRFYVCSKALLRGGFLLFCSPTFICVKKVS